MDNEFGLKELYEVALKATYPIEVGNRIIETGEIIAVFDKIQVAGFDENKEFKKAQGGFDNRSLVWWEETKEIRLSVTQGVFSKEHFILMTNAKLIDAKPETPLLISKREYVETDDAGIANLSNVPYESVFVYDKNTGEKFTDFELLDSRISIGQSYRDIIVDYIYQYNNNYQTLSFGRELTAGFLSLEGKTRVKDDTTGHVKTGIIKIPKLKLLSNLSMRLGQDAIPLVGRLDAVAVPTGVKGQKQVMELIFLDDDIDSDM